MEDFAQRLCRLMKEKQITVTDLAERTGINQSTISRYMLGYFVPKQRRTDLIAKALDVTPTYLMFGDELDDYYTDIDTARLAQELKENPSYRALLDASRTLTPKAITEVMEFIKSQKMKERGEND